MKSYLFLFITFCMSTSACAQKLPDKLLGNWIYKGSNSETHKVECPDMLVLKSTTYSVVNDCYGEDNMFPAVENGNLTYDANTKAIIMTQRACISNYTFHSRAKRLILYVKEINGNSMKVYFGSMNDRALAVFEKKK